MIDIGTDRDGHSLRLLVWQGLKQFSTAALLQFLEDRDVTVRSIAAKELHVRGGRKVFERASQLLNSAQIYKREIGAFLLGQLGTPRRPYKKESIKLLLQSLRSDQNRVVRATVITALGQLKASEALGRVVTFAKDRSPKVRGSVAFAIGMIYCERSKEIPSRLKNLLRELQADKSRTVRELATLGMELVQGENRTEESE